MTFICQKDAWKPYFDLKKNPAVPGESKYPFFGFFKITSRTIGGYYRWIYEVLGHILFGSHGSTLGSFMGPSLL